MNPSRRGFFTGLFAAAATVGGLGLNQWFRDQPKQITVGDGVPDWDDLVRHEPGRLSTGHPPLDDALGGGFIVGEFNLLLLPPDTLVAEVLENRWRRRGIVVERFGAKTIPGGPTEVITLTSRGITESKKPKSFVLFTLAKYARLKGITVVFFDTHNSHAGRHQASLAAEIKDGKVRAFKDRTRAVPNEWLDMMPARERVA